MLNVLVCYKWVLDEQDIKINPGNLSLDTSRAKYKIGEYDKNVIEEAVLIKEKQEAKVTALTFGTAEVKKSLKDLLSRGPDKAYFIADEAAVKADAFVTANVLAAAIRKTGPYDLIICGDGSSDAYNQQIAPRLGEILGIPAITFVQQLIVEGNRVIATRKMADCTEVATVEGPAVISVLPVINKPRIPSLKQVLAASKKPNEEIKIADLGIRSEELTPKVTSLTVKGFVMKRKNIIFKDASEAENVAQLVDSLAKEGLNLEGRG